MPRRNTGGGGRRRNQRESQDAGTMDLFQAKMVAAMQASLAGSSGEATESSCDAPADERDRGCDALVATCFSGAPAPSPTHTAPAAHPAATDDSPAAHVSTTTEVLPACEASEARSEGVADTCCDEGVAATAGVGATLIAEPGRDADVGRGVRQIRNQKSEPSEANRSGAEIAEGKQPRAEAGQIENPGETLPARMLNEFVYCARLFYYEHVEGVFVESADTVRGAAIHQRVDKGSGAMPRAVESSELRFEASREVRGAVGTIERSEGDDAPTKSKKKKAGTGDGDSGDAKPDAAGAAADSGNDGAQQIGNQKSEIRNPDVIHSRSVMLGSERFGVVAKMDLVETTVGGDGGVESVCPVDYKAGSPREGEEANELWDTDRMQLGVQCLVLRENGYRCDGGIIYYRGTKQRVPLEYTQGLEAWIVAKIAAARAVSKGPIPPPLTDSPKCVRCSLAPVCLPDETAMLARNTGFQPVRPVDFQSGEDEPRQAGSPLSAQAGSPCSIRRLMAARDEKRVLFLNTPGYRVGCNDGVLKVKDKDRVVDEVRVSDVSQVALFGNIQISTQAIQLLCEMGVPITFFSMGGWFYGIARGHGLKNVTDRIAQFRHAGDPAACLRFARQFVRGKIHNQRVLFMRNHEQPPERVRLRLGQAREDLEKAASLEALLGMEGAAAAEYFAEFAGMLRPQEEDEIPGLETNVPEAPWARFDFNGRNRRPPTDPVNALLSLAYSLLAKECTVAAYAVGLDPYVGFYHQPRHGRPALALDLMEEFRPLIAESAVLTAINNRYVTPRDFVTAGRAVNLSPAGRKQFFQCFEQRMSTLITHPVFDYKVSYRRAVELQFRILARVLTGEITEYVPFLTR